MELLNNRPETLESYIGQDHIKARIKMAAQAALLKNCAFPHTIMHGPPGLGKTTLAKIIAKEMGVPFYSYMATSLSTPEQVESILGKICKNGYDRKTGKIEDSEKIVPCVIFLDEVHNMSQRITELFHTVLEDFKITLRKRTPEGFKPQTFWVPQFTLVAATNYLGELPKPFIDRFPIRLPFEIYSDEDILRVITNNAIRNSVSIEPDAAMDIAVKSRGVPRIAMSYFSKSQDVAVVRNFLDVVIKKSDVSKMFEIEEIDELGLDKTDRKVLSYLARLDRPIGLKALAQAVDEDHTTVENFVEPWLVNLGFIVRSGAGRCITDEGRDFIKVDKDSALCLLEE